MSYAEFQCFAKYFIESNAHHNNVKLDGQVTTISLQSVSEINTYQLGVDRMSL